MPGLAGYIRYLFLSLLIPLNEPKLRGQLFKGPINSAVRKGRRDKINILVGFSNVDRETGLVFALIRQRNVASRILRAVFNPRAARNLLRLSLRGNG